LASAESSPDFPCTPFEVIDITMTRRVSFLATLALVASLATAAQAQTSLAFGTFGQTTGTPSVSYTGGGDLPSTLTVNTTGFFSIIEPNFLIDPGGPLFYSNVSFSLTATSNTAAEVNGNESSQNGFEGTFTMTSGGTNILSGDIDLALLSQRVPNAASFESESVSYSSDIFLPGLFDEQFILSFLTLTPQTLSVGGGGGFNNFTARSTSGNFSAAIPEPATLAMAGLGIFALPLAVRTARRRRSTAN
jgi:hypothetical protein